jgi:dihydrofolate reductase
MSRSQSLIPGVKVYTDINKLINDFKSEDIYIIGGASLYNEFMSYADELIISKINKSYNCDVFMKCDFSK